MALLDLYRALKKESLRLITQEKERRKEAIKLRLELHKKAFDRKREVH